MQAIGRMVAMSASLAVILFFWVPPGSARAAGPPQFVVPEMTKSPGVLPQDLASADFNTDGNADVAVANLGPDAFQGSVGVLLGDGAGNLGDPILTGLGAQNGAAQVVPGAFDNDGIPDLAVLTGTTGGFGAIDILLGSGDGTFTIAQQQLAAGAEGHVLVGELTGDRKQDVAFVFRASSQVVLYPGKGNATFGQGTTFNRTWGGWDATLGDTNGDGRLDIIGAAGGPVWVMLNEGGGAFGQQIFQFSDDLSGFRLTTGDFDGGGVLDVAMANASGGDVQIGLGNGDGSFDPFAVYRDVSFATDQIAAGDWTGDGKLDLIVNNESGDPSAIALLMKGKGDGTFGKFTYWATQNQGPIPVSLDDDGHLDLVTFSADPGRVYATRGGPNGTFRAPQSVPVTGLGSPAQGDVDGDGDLDVVTMGVVLPQPGVLTVRVFTHLNQGDGRFAKAVVSKTHNVEAGDGPGQVVLADVNEDGDLDLVAGFTHLFAKPSNVWVLLGRGDGRFTNLAEYNTDTNASNVSIAVADVTNDGNLDIIGHALATLAVLPGTGNGTFGAPILSGNSTPSQTDTLVADFTGDGDLDVVAVIRTGGEDFGSGDLRLEEGAGNGTFALVQTRSFDGNPGAAVVANLNGDARPDVAVTGTRGSNGGRTGLRVSLNANGSLGPIVFYPFPPFPFGDLDAADFDLDGDVDLVGTGLAALAVALNDGSGAFTGVAEFIASGGTRLAGDFTGDGKPDVLVLLQTNLPMLALYVNAMP